jgi:hypothetical protein
MTRNTKDSARGKAPSEPSVCCFEALESRNLLSGLPVLHPLVFAPLHVVKPAIHALVVVPPKPAVTGTAQAAAGTTNLVAPVTAGSAVGSQTVVTVSTAQATNIGATPSLGVSVQSVTGNINGGTI